MRPSRKSEPTYLVVGPTDQSSEFQIFKFSEETRQLEELLTGSLLQLTSYINGISIGPNSSWVGISHQDMTAVYRLGQKTLQHFQSFSNAEDVVFGDQQMIVNSPSAILVYGLMETPEDVEDESTEDEEPAIDEAEALPLWSIVLMSLTGAVVSFCLIGIIWANCWFRKQEEGEESLSEEKKSSDQRSSDRKT